MERHRLHQLCKEATSLMKRLPRSYRFLACLETVGPKGGKRYPELAPWEVLTKPHGHLVVMVDDNGDRFNGAMIPWGTGESETRKLVAKAVTRYVRRRSGEPITVAVGEDGHFQIKNGGE